MRSQYAKLGASRSQVPDAILVAPATYNTICKWAQGISDTYALGVLAEATGLGVPTVVRPFVNTALASRAPFRRSVESLRAEGVTILFGPGGVQPHPPRTGGNLVDTYPLAPRPRGGRTHIGSRSPEAVKHPLPSALPAR